MLVRTSTWVADLEKLSIDRRKLCLLELSKKYVFCFHDP